MRKDFDKCQSLSHLPIEVTLFLLSYSTRDLKLENTLINAHGHVRVGDLGLATLSNGEKQHDICGTCYFMAPEVSQRELFAFSNIRRLSVNVSGIKKKKTYTSLHMNNTLSLGFWSQNPRVSLFFIKKTTHCHYHLHHGYHLNSLSDA